MAEDPNSFAARSRAAYQNAYQQQTQPPNASSQQHVGGGGMPYTIHQRGPPTMNYPQPPQQLPPLPSYRPRGGGGNGVGPPPPVGPPMTYNSASALPVAIPTATVTQKTKQDIEQKTLNDVKHRLGLEAYAMKRSMDQPIGPSTQGQGQGGSMLVSFTNGLDTSLSQTLDHCVSMLTELASSSDKISPKHYYEIHMFVSSQMQFMEEYLEGLPDEWNTAAGAGATTTSSSSSLLVTPNDLYEIVQYCPKVLQRSYLMIAAGSALLKSTTTTSTTTTSADSSAPGEAAAAGGGGGGGTIAAICDAMMTNALITAEKEIQPEKSSTEQVSSNMKWKNDVTRMVLNELMETVKGVQCPLRGLFLRHYLLQSFKDKLPDTHTKYGNDLSISYQFILKNFDEMNRLWIRIQHMPGANRSKSERKRREKERASLRLLVGSNLERLSQLDGITIDIYQTVILPHILQTICDCNDTLAQAYLMDCTIQVFSDHYHLTTLETLLSVLPLLNEKVNVRYLLQNIMDRLALPDEEDDDDEEDATNGATQDGGTVTKKEMKRWNYYQTLGYDPFKLFDQCIYNVHEKKGSKIGLKEMIRLVVKLMEFALAMPTDPFVHEAGNGTPQQQHIDHVNHCLTFVLKHFLYPLKNNNAEGEKAPLNDPEVSEQLELLLKLPLQKLGLSAVLDLSSYAEVLLFLPSNHHRKQVALGILETVTSGKGQGNVVNSNKEDDTSSNHKKLDSLYNILKPLIDEMPPNRSSMGGDEEDFYDKLDMHTYEQSILLGTLPRYWFQTYTNISNSNDSVPDTDGLFQICTIARKHVMKGPKENWSYTIPPLLYCVMQLIRQVHALEFPAPTANEDAAPPSAPAPAPPSVPAPAPPSAPAPAPPSDPPPPPPASPPTSDQTNNDNDNHEAASDPVTDDTTTSNADKGGDVASSEQDDNKNGNESADSPDKQEPSITNNTQSLQENKVGVPPPMPPTSLPPPPPPPQVFDKIINCRKLFVFLQKVISSVSQHYPELAIHFYLESALVADRCGILSEERRRRGTKNTESKEEESSTAKTDTNSNDDTLFQDMPLYNNTDESEGGDSNFNAMTLEFVTLAYRCYEDDLMTTAAITTTNNSNDTPSTQVRCLQHMVATLLKLQLLTPKEYLSFTTKTAQCAARLAKKSDQSRSVALCSLLFDRTEPPLGIGMNNGATATTNNPQRVLECLQRSLKVADMCLKATSKAAGGGGGGNNIQLFVDALEYYVYYFVKDKTPSITDIFVSSLIQLINEHVDSSKDYSDAAIQAQTHYRHILSYMEQHKKTKKQQAQPSDGSTQ